MSYTSYLPAMPKVQRLATADPWPVSTERLTILYGRALYRYYARPARLFPAANFCPLSARPKPPAVRIDTSKLPVMTLAEWREEQWCLADRQTVQPRRRPPPRKIGWFERQIDKLVAWRTGANKIKPDWRVFSHSHNDESWLT